MNIFEHHLSEIRKIIFSEKDSLKLQDIEYLKGDPRKALKDLNFKFKYDIKDLVKDMLDSDIEKEKKSI